MCGFRFGVPLIMDKGFREVFMEESLNGASVSNLGKLQSAAASSPYQRKAELIEKIRVSRRRTGNVGRTA